MAQVATGEDRAMPLTRCHLGGIELVSPVYAAAGYWASDLEVIFTAVQAAYTVIPSPHCSTHVHVSGALEPLSASELAALSKAVLYFEPAMDELVPATRRGSSTYWCQSNRANPALSGYGLDDAFALLDHAAASAGKGVRPVVETMNLVPAGCAYGRAHGKKHDFVRGKVYKWDLSHMLGPKSGGGDGLGTIEFRQPPGSVSADEAVGWITLALAFVAGSVGGVLDTSPGSSVVGRFGSNSGSSDGGSDGEVEGGSLGDLWNFLVTGAHSLGWEDLTCLEEVLGRQGI